MKIVAIFDRSAGNESVGEMWQDTAIFEPNTPVVDIVSWAQRRTSKYGKADDFVGCLKITVADNTRRENS